MTIFVVFVDNLSRWVEAHPTRTEKSSEVVKVLLKEIIPHFGLRSHIQSENGPAFVSELHRKLVNF